MKHHPLKILITGSTAQVGLEVCRSLAPLGEITACSRSECELSDPISIHHSIRACLRSKRSLATAFSRVAVALALTGCDHPDRSAEPPPKLTDAERPEQKALLTTDEGDLTSLISERVAAREMTKRSMPPADATETLMNEFPGATPERRSEILALLGASAAPEAWPFLVANAVSGKKDLRMAALDALAIHAGGDPSPAIRACLASEDMELRALAATLLGRTAKDPAAWSAAAVDPSPDVRVAYHAAIAEAPVDIRLQSARAALATSDPQLRIEGAAVAGATLSHSAIDVLIPVLADPAAKDTASDGLFFLLGRHFESATEAQTWWSAHRDGFTADLLEK